MLLPLSLMMMMMMMVVVVVVAMMMKWPLRPYPSKLPVLQTDT